MVVLKSSSFLSQPAAEPSPAVWPPPPHSSFCQDSLHRVSATADLRILSTWVAGLAWAGLTWLTGFGDSLTPTSTDTSDGSPVLACVCHCHCESGGIAIACLCLAFGLCEVSPPDCRVRRSSVRGRSGDSGQGRSVGLHSSSAMFALNIPERQILLQFPDDPTSHYTIGCSSSEFEMPYGWLALRITKWVFVTSAHILSV